MGYNRKAKAKTYHLTFEGEDYEGLEITVRSTSMEGLIDIARLQEVDKEKVSIDDLASLQPLFSRFIRSVVEWNLEDDDGAPVPVTVEALLDQDVDFVMDTVLAWVEAIAGVPGPLGQTSNGGQQLEEVSLPMEPLSESQAS